jgi:hypothetical protein
MVISFIFSAASLIISGCFFVFFRKYVGRRTGPGRLEAEREEADKLIAEIDAITDRDITLVEARIKSLRALLEEADRRIAVYAKELDRRRSQEAAYIELGRKRHTPKAMPPEEEAEKPPSDGVKVIEFKGDPPAKPPEAELKNPSLKERVTELARAGFSSELIAARIGAPRAEVDLVIALSSGQNRE